eukprot:6140937-Prymnesium_polylepis.2
MANEPILEPGGAFRTPSDDRSTTRWGGDGSAHATRRRAGSPSLILGHFDAVDLAWAPGQAAHGRLDSVPHFAHRNLVCVDLEQQRLFAQDEAVSVRCLGLGG